MQGEGWHGWQGMALEQGQEKYSVGHGARAGSSSQDNGKYQGDKNRLNQQQQRKIVLKEPEAYIEVKSLRVSWVVQSIKHPTLGFGLGRNHRVMRSSSASGSELSTESV